MDAHDRILALRAYESSFLAIVRAEMFVINNAACELKPPTNT
jgi:hypothetical protein